MSIELRSKIENHLWRAFWDAAFAGASTLLALVFGATFGNIVRGVGIDDDGYFSTPLFTTFFPSKNPGALDAYTVAVGLFAVAALGAHGALFLKWKTKGAIAERAAKVARTCLIAAGVLDIAVAVASAFVNPDAVHAFASRPLAWLFAVAALGGVIVIVRALSQRRELAPFLGSCLFLAGTLLAGACALAPMILRSTIAAEYSLDAAHAASGAHGLAIGLYWFVPGIMLAIIYVVWVFRSTRGKVDANAYH